MKRIERLININIEIIKSKQSTPSEIIDYTRKKQKEQEYDRAFCVIDGDVLKQTEIKTGSRLKPIISYPCFEVWLLLHFKYTGKEFYNCDDLINLELKKYIPDYHKSKDYHAKKNFYKMLKENLRTAIENAKKLDRENKKTGKPGGTSSEIYIIIEEIFTPTMQKKK